MGVGTGIVGAYVLAGELAAARGDHRPALTAYENRMRGYAARWQRSANPGQFLAPTTATRLCRHDGTTPNSTRCHHRHVHRLALDVQRSLDALHDEPDAYFDWIRRVPSCQPWVDSKSAW